MSADVLWSWIPLIVFLTALSAGYWAFGKKTIKALKMLK